MYNLDHITFSGDIGRIAAFEEKILEAVIICPKLKFNGKTHSRPTQALVTCVRRVQEKSRCIKDCRYADAIIIALAQGHEFDV
jgi:hypothetical protein